MLAISVDEPLKINGLAYNRTALRDWNYTYYEGNGTLSNASACYLVFGQYRPSFFANGTFSNATSCSSSINLIQTRGTLCLIFGSLFGVSILFSTINLRKHGRSYLPRENRWKAIGRRWQFYWMLFCRCMWHDLCIRWCGCRSRLPAESSDELAMLLLTLLMPGLNAALWESVRHWGSWQHRQIQDANPFAFRHGDLRSRVELYLPLLFYLADWGCFLPDDSPVMDDGSEAAFS